jgi:hypothetical protein
LGIRCKKEIKKGEVLIAIPKSFIINSDDAERE